VDWVSAEMAKISHDAARPWKLGKTAGLALQSIPAGHRNVAGDSVADELFEQQKISKLR
jgi:hypothetical protein